MAIMLKQDDEIVVPSTFTHRGNSINSIFGEKIILDESSMTNEWNHPLFKAAVKYLFSPITGQNQDFSDIEKNLDEFLSVSYMRNAAEQTDGMTLNSEEYQKHITFVWDKLKAITIGDLLVGAKQHIKIKPFGNETSTAIDLALNSMPGEGKEQKLSAINNIDEQEAWEKMTGFRIKHSKLVEVANASDRPGKRNRVYKEFMENLSNHAEHIEMKVYSKPLNAAKEFKLGSKARQGSTLNVHMKRFIDIEIDFKSMFEAEMQRDDILEGMPVNEWIPSLREQTKLEEEAKAAKEGDDIKLASDEKPYAKWDINEAFPKILTDRTTGEDRVLTSKEEDTWEEIFDLISEEPVSLEEPEKLTEEQKEFYAHAEEPEDVQRPDEELYGTRHRGWGEGDLSGFKDSPSGDDDTTESETEWSPTSMANESGYTNWDKQELLNKPKKQGINNLKDRHLLLIQQAVYWQTYNKLKIAEWQQEAAVLFNSKQLEQEGAARAKKKEIVHAPMGTTDQDRRLFKKEPTESMDISNLDLLNAFNSTGSRKSIRNALKIALNPSNGVVLKLSIAGYHDIEDKPNTDTEEGDFWVNKVWGVYYLEDIQIDKKVKWGYSGVTGQKTTTVGKPLKTKGTWTQVPKRPSRTTELGRGEDRPQRSNLLQPKESTHEIPETIDPETGQHRMVDPETQQYPRTPKTFGVGLDSRKEMGFLQSGGSVRGQWGQEKWVVLMGYLRKQYREIEEMMERA